MGTLGGGISNYNGTKFTNYTEQEGLTKNHVQSILQDRNGAMWFGFSGGVFRLNGFKLVNVIKEGC
jgi:ligand-binding sensor domain-containing protein